MKSPLLSAAVPPPVVTMRPMVLLSGFLGAGKTTFLRHCLTELADRQLLADVILNDRENAELDCETLRERAASVAALAGSCVCCDGMEQLAELALAASKSDQDVLFVELNGTADPVPLLEAFTLMESRFLMRPRWQVGVVDVRHFGTRGAFSDLETLQIETASHLYYSHKDEVDPANLQRVRERARTINPGASETDVETMTGHLAHAIARNQGLAVGSVDESKVSSSLSSPRPTDPRHRLAHEFTGCQILIPEPQRPQRLLSWLAELPRPVIRAKALTRTADEPDVRHLFERVGSEVCPVPIRVPISDRVPASVILIGADLDPDSLLQSARNQLGKTCVLG
ncbi:MAG: GTP-binding protein [Verrucomicrobiota bacterium]